MAGRSRPETNRPLIPRRPSSSTWTMSSPPEDPDAAVGLRHPDVRLAERVLLLEPEREAVLRTTAQRVPVHLESIDGRDERVDVGAGSRPHGRIVAPLGCASRTRSSTSRATGPPAGRPVDGRSRREREEQRCPGRRDRQKKVPLSAHSSSSSPGFPRSFPEIRELPEQRWCRGDISWRVRYALAPRSS